MNLRTNFQALLAGCLLLIAPHTGSAATFNFDLTEDLGADFSAEENIDLKRQFAAIDSATVEMSGFFTPGMVTPVTIPEHTGPVIASDTVNLIIRLGEVGTAWIEKNVYAIQTLVGYQGNVAFALPLQGVISPSSPLPVFLPSGDLPADFSFLLDGRFEISTGTTHWLASLYQTLESPQFTLNTFTLRIEGTVVPEPSGAMVALLFSAIFFRRPLTRR